MDLSLLWRTVWAQFWRDELLWLITMVTALALVLYLRRREDHDTLGNTLGLGVLSLGGMLVAAVLSSIGGEAAGAVVREIFVVLGGVTIIRLWGQLVFRVVLPLAGLLPPRILEDLIVIVAYVSWGLVRLRFAGLDLSSIVTTSAVITAIVAFSMQDTLGNILGGLALELDSGFEIGDWIKVDDVTGQVVDIRWRSVSIQTRNWETVIVPNSHMVRSKVIVLGRRQARPFQWRRWIWFSVALSSSPTTVIAAVEDALRSAVITNVASDPAPNCLIMDFDRGDGRYAVRYWLTDLANDDSTDSAVREHILAALQRAGMRVAVPEQNIHVIAQDSAHAEQVLARELGHRVHSLRAVDLFNELTDEEVRVLAARLVPAPFAQGDVITRQSAVAHWLYILAAGDVDVAIERPGQALHTIVTLHAPTVFGEMGLLTGEPRRATIIARSGVECYRLEKGAFQDILLERPSLAERMSHVLAERQVDFHRSVNGLVTDTGPRQSTRLSEEILAKIKRFFAIATG